MRSEAPAPGPRRGGFRLPLGAGTRIILFVLAAFLPLFGLHIYAIAQISDAELSHIQDDVANLAHRVSLSVEGTVDTARSTALALSTTPTFRAQDPVAASAVLSSVLAQHTVEYINLWAARADGTVYATALPTSQGQPGSIAAEPYFQMALSSGQPVVTTVRGIPQRPDVFAALVAVPVPGEGTLQIAFQLPGLQPLAQHIGLPTNSVVVIVDGQGTIIARSLQPERWVGVNVSNTIAWMNVKSIEAGTWEGPGVDGVVRLHGIQTVPGTDWRAIVGLPSPAVYAPLRTSLTREAALFALTLVLAGIITWRGYLLADQVETERRRLQGIIDQLPEGVLVATPAGRVLQANRALGRICGTLVRVGAPYREQVDRTLTWLEGDRPVAWEDLPSERARRGEVVRGVQLAVQCADGSRRDVLVNALPLRGPGGDIEEALTVVADITPLKDLDRAKDQFISIAAHELRNPVAGLKGYAQILLRQARQKGYDEETIRALAAVDQQANRLTQLTSRLLDVSRLQLGRLEVVRRPTDIVGLAREVQESQQLATTRHRITVEASPERIVGEFDPDALHQVLDNLVGNAIKYAPGGEIAIRLFQEGEQVDVFVSDQGPGIAPEQLPHVFERFRQLGARPEERAGGLGLGLYLSKGIVEAHGGRIGVRSEVGRGATFWFVLPLHAGGMAHEPAPELLARAQVAR